MSAHRIDFKQFDVIVRRIGSPGIPPQVLVTWTIEPVRTGGDEITFLVERSQDPSFADTDAIQSIASVPGAQGQNVYEHLDITVNLQSFWRKWYYRVKVEDLTPNRRFFTDIKSWESDPKIFELEIIARNDWLLQYETGTPCFAIIERTAGGSHCQACYNPSLKRTTVSNCTQCFGTGRERPFYEPILTYVDFNPPPKIVQVTSMGETQAGQTDIWWSAFPQLKPRDILVEVLSGQRWRVVGVNLVGDVRTDIHHFGRIEQINRRDVEYQIAIPEAVQTQAVVDLETMKKERRF
jgi:hypothetical protein